MKTTRLTVIVAITAFIAAFQLRAGVQVSTAQVKEKSVVLRVADKNFVTASSGGALDLSGVKVGSKQTFVLIDLNGGELADGDAIKIQYVPNSGGKPDPSKASYWVETKEGIKRGKDGDSFKVKKVGDKYTLQTSGGKFVGSAGEEGVLTLTDKQEAALLVEVLDPLEAKAMAKAAKKASSKPAPTAEPAAAVPEKSAPAAEPAIPAPEKPATE